MEIINKKDTDGAWHAITSEVRYTREPAGGVFVCVCGPRPGLMGWEPAGYGPTVFSLKLKDPCERNTYMAVF